ncbi:MAG: AAA family ATPase, partial [Chloroflexi bacterium]
QGYEAQIRTEVARRREAQLAAMLALEEDTDQVLTFSPKDMARERWLQRTISSAGERLAALRDRVLDGAKLKRHSLVLDLKAGSGLLTWEALRRVPEGGVYALARTERDAEALRQLAERLPEVERPRVMHGSLADLPALIAAEGGAAQPSPTFDALVGYNALIDVADKQAAIQGLVSLIAAHATISLAERIPRHTQRLYQLVDLGELGQELAERVVAAEEAIYADPDDPLVNWDADDLRQFFSKAGLSVELATEAESSELQVTAGVIERWFAPSGSDRPSYGERLAQHLSTAEVAQVQALFERQLLNQVVAWRGRLLYLTGSRSG